MFIQQSKEIGPLHNLDSIELNLDSMELSNES